MLRTLIGIGVMSLVCNSSARAEGHGLGVGAQTMTGTGILPAAGLGIQYDTGTFHIDGIMVVSVVDDVANAFGIGGRFYFVVHRTDRSDFGIGGGVATVIDDPVRGDSELGLLLEAGGKIRAFIVPNVAITATLGVSSFVIENSSRASLSGRLLGSGGIVYFFQ